MSLTSREDTFISSKAYYVVYLWIIILIFFVLVIFLSDNTLKKNIQKQSQIKLSIQPLEKQINQFILHV